MVEPLSPLTLKCVAGRHGASGDAGLVLSSRPINGLWQIAGWENFETIAKPLLETLGLPGLGNYRQAQAAGGVTSWRIAPDKLLLEGADDLTSHTAADLMVLDLGHARAAITLEGAAARDLLAQLIAIDTAPSAFGPGEFLQTGIHHVGVLIHCTGENSFDILVPGTWSETVWDVVVHNALPHGLTIKEAA